MSNQQQPPSVVRPGGNPPFDSTAVTTLPKSPILSILGTIVFIAGVSALIVVNIVHPDAAANLTLDVQIIGAMGAALAYLKSQELSVQQNGLHQQFNSRFGEMATSAYNNGIASGKEIGAKEATAAAAVLASTLLAQQAASAVQLATEAARTLAATEARHGAEITAAISAVGAKLPAAAPEPTPAQVPSVSKYPGDPIL